MNRIDTSGQKIKNVLARFEGAESELIPLLQEVQIALGFLPEHAMQAIAQFTGVPDSRVYSVATFYTQFRFSPIGRNHVVVCRGTACHVRGATKILEKIERQLSISEGDTTDDMEYSLDTAACIGACGLAPTIVINDKTFGRLTADRVSKLIVDVGSKEKDSHDKK